MFCTIFSAKNRLGNQNRQDFAREEANALKNLPASLLRRIKKQLMLNLSLMANYGANVLILKLVEELRAKKSVQIKTLLFP